MIASKIGDVIDPGFRASLSCMTSAYGDGHAGERIAEALATCPLGEVLIQKQAIEIGVPCDPKQ